MVATSSSMPHTRSFDDERSVPDTLDELLRLDAPTLAALYRDAAVPSVEDLDGDLEGRMLVGPVGPRLAAVMRAAGGWKRFPWLGKSFRATSAGRGEGVNRVFTDKIKLFKFETFVGKSRAGDFDAVQLDYDLASNPGVIRAIKDEVRELKPGLWLGQAYAMVRGRPRLALYFALARRA